MKTLLAALVALLATGGAAKAMDMGWTKDGYPFMFVCENADDAAPVRILEDGADTRFDDLSFCIENRGGGVLVPKLCNEQWCHVPGIRVVSMPAEGTVSGRPRYFVRFFGNPVSDWVEFRLDIVRGTNENVVTVRGLSKAELQLVKVSQ